MIDVRDLKVRYGRAILAVDGVDITVGDGEVVCLLGANGAGKSTLLRAISGTLDLHGGRVVGGDVTISGVSGRRRDAARIVRAGVAQVPEGRRVFGRMKVTENLRAGAHTQHSRRRRSEMLETVLELFPVLHERRDQRAALLSGGEQQMLAIGRALMSDPKTLLLDEPSLGLAPLIVAQIGRLIERVHEFGVAVLLVEQNAAMALSVADRAYVLETGRVAMTGRASDLASSEALRDLYLGKRTEAGPS